MSLSKGIRASRLASVGLLLSFFAGTAAADSWTAGQDLFNTNCSGCHTSSAKDQTSLITLNAQLTPVTGQPCMIGTAVAGSCPGATTNAVNLTGLTATQRSQIVAFLSTPRHASLAPATFDFLLVPIGKSPQLTKDFVLTSDGDSSRGDPQSAVTPGALTVVDDSGFGHATFGCLGALSVGSDCTVRFTFKPVTNIPYSTPFTLAHNGYGGGSSATVSGTGQLNLEIETAGPLSFTATGLSNSVQIANPLGTGVKLCVVAATVTKAAFSHPDQFSFQGTQPCIVLPNPLAIPLKATINFSATAPQAPQYASLTAQRVDSNGNGLEPAIQADDFLVGNAGPFDSTTITASPPSSPNCTVTTQLFSGYRQERKVGASACSFDLTISNSGSETLRILGIAVVGQPLPAGSPAKAVVAAEYPLASGIAGACAVGTQLQELIANSKCVVRVAFDPDDLGIRPAQLQIQYSDVANTAEKRRTVMKDLAGIGFDGAELSVAGVTPPAPPASNSSIAYGTQNINIVYPRRIELKNIGSDDPLSISPLTIPAAPSGFDVVSPANIGCAGILTTTPQALTLQPGASCFLDVRFLPKQSIHYAASVAVQSTPTGSGIAPVEFRVDLSGDGANNIPRLLWKDTTGASDVSSLDFRCPTCPATPVGSTTPPSRKIVLENQGIGAAALQFLNLVGPDAANFAIDPTLSTCKFGDQAPPLFVTTCEVVVNFNPLSAGTKSANLQLISSGSTPQPIVVVADAAGPLGVVSVNAQPGTIDFDLVRLGAESSPVVVTLSNTGGVTAMVTTIDADVPFTVKPGTCQSAPFVLAPQSSCTVLVTFSPTSEARTTGALRVQVSGQPAPVTASLTGDGLEKADVSGGCTVVDGESQLDPTLWTLVTLAAGALFNRRRLRRHDIQLRANQ